MIIPKIDRKRIKSGDPKVTQFWLSVFSLYRISECDFSSKLNSITDPFSGDMEQLKAVKDHCFTVKGNPFKYLNAYQGWLESANLYPSKLSFIQSASPSNKISWHGMLTDYKILVDLKLMPLINEYLSKVGSTYMDDIFGDVASLYERLASLARVEYKKLHPNSEHKGLENFIPSKKKGNFSGLAGQLSFKEEAAGKLRVFAMVDFWTQNILRPLHKSLFNLLKLIPNDGTFDQDASVKRSIQKSLVSGCAYSFDLSSATDRLPIDIQVSILDMLFPQKIGELWKALLVSRDYHVPGYKTLISDQVVKYAVGQPMGALSSWAMLAVTHHYLLQLCAYRLGKLQSWEENYEILGDDLVIFEPKLAQEYLMLCKQLGVEINLSKSIVSPNKPSFEFAKRTVLQGTNVSAISFKQLISETSVASRLANTLYFAKQGLVRTNFVLATLLSRFKIKALKELLFPLSSLLGVFFKQKKISHNELFGMFVDPEELDWETQISLPFQGLLNLSRGILNDVNPLPRISHEDVRLEVGQELTEILSDYILLDALSIAKKLERNFEAWKGSTRTVLVSNWEKLLTKEVLESECIFLDEFIFDTVDNFRSFDPSEEVDRIEKLAIQQAKWHTLSIEEALIVLEKLSTLVREFNLSAKAPKVKMTEGTSQIFKYFVSNFGDSSNLSYLRNRPDYS